jgi:hypothetical protein
MELSPAPYLLSIESLSRLLDGFGDGEWPCGIASRGRWEMRMEAEKEGVHAYLQKCNARYHPFLRFLAAVVLGVQQKMTFRFATPTYVQSVHMLLSHVLIRETYC